MELEERFWSKVDWNIDESHRCWDWLAARNNKGYGRFTLGPTLGFDRTYGVYAHRISYELEVGEIPAGFWIDHLCRNTSCVNPRHLEVVTPGENTRRGNAPARAAVANRNRWATATKCKRGHDLTPENVYVTPSTGHRRCRICHQAYQRAWRASNPAYLKEWRARNA